MKKILLSIALFLSLGITAWAQVPQQFNYQGIARNAGGTPLASTGIGLRLTIHEGTSTGAVDYQETQTTTTNQFGIYTIAIGTNSIVNTDGGGAATLGAVNWGTGSKFLQVEIDPMGSTNYSVAGTAQLLSVPYALYAGNSPATGVTQVTAGAGLNGGTITSTGTISMPNEGVPGTYGSGTTVPVFTTDAQGRVTAVTNTPITAGAGTVTNINTGAGLTGGPITGSGTISLGTAGTAGSYGDATHVPVFTTDIYGRVTAVTNTAITAGAGSVTSVTAGAGLSGGTITTTGTVSMPTVGTAGTYGSATAVPVITTDAYGRVTGVTTATISGGGSGSVSGTTNYIAKFTSATAVGNSGMYNTAAGDVGLGTIAPIAKFDVETTDSMAGNFVSTAPAAPQNGVLNGTYSGTDIINPSVGVIGTALPDPSITADVGVGTVGVGGSLGVSAVAEATSITGYSTAVQGQSFCDGIISCGVLGAASGALAGPVQNWGVYGTTDLSGGVNYAGEFDGDLDCSGDFTCGGTKFFRMDDPLDPANKFLYHSCVESNEMMNIYTGNATTDAGGVAAVILPAYFEALNQDFRYQLTVIGTFAQAIISKKVSGNNFEIKTNQPNVEVSWQITAVRHDAYAVAHPMKTEVEKPAQLKGMYIHPDLFGQPLSKKMGRIEPKELKLKGVKDFSSVAKTQRTAPTNTDKK